MSEIALTERDISETYQCLKARFKHKKQAFDNLNECSRNFINSTKR